MKPLFAALFLALSTLTQAGTFKEIVTFGDSLTDMGNRSVGPGKTDVKYRENWVKQLAAPDKLNIPTFKPSGMSAYFGGTNYAVGGSTTEYTAKWLPKDANKGQHLTQQISKRYLNPAFNTDGVKKDALHIIVMGTNDLAVALISPDQLAGKWATMDKVGIAVAQSTESQIDALAKAGVTQVMWGNLFDSSQAPSVTTRINLISPNFATVVLASIVKAVDAHNQEMDAAIIRLQTAHPGLKIIKLDLHARFAEVAANPTKFGFVDVTTGKNDDKHLFSADGLHPTQQGHRMLADYAYQVITGTSVAAQ